MTGILGGMRISFLLTVLACEMAGAQTTGAGCTAYVTDLHQELVAITGSVSTVAASGDPATATEIPHGRAVDVRLVAQRDTTFAHPPERTRGGAGSFAGLVSLGSLSAGRWRVSLNRTVWVDLVSGGQLLASPDFEMQAQCPEIAKSVVFEQRTAGIALLQISGAETPAVRLLVSRAAPAGTPALRK